MTCARKHAAAGSTAPRTHTSLTFFTALGAFRDTFRLEARGGVGGVARTGLANSADRAAAADTSSASLRSNVTKDGLRGFARASATAGGGGSNTGELEVGSATLLGGNGGFK